MTTRTFVRFSLRTLLLATFVVAVWCAFHANRGRYERNVENALLEAGAKVDSGVDRSTGKPREWTAYERFLGGVFAQRLIRRVDAHQTKLSPQILERVWHLPHLESVTLCDCQLSDEHLRSLGQASGLDTLLLEDDGLTDDGLKGLESLRELRYVHFYRGDLGDATLRRLALRPKLEHIALWKTKATGEGVHSLACRQSLLAFSAEDTPIQDDFLATLAACPTLERLSVVRTQVGDRGLEHLRGHSNLRFLSHALPNLTDRSLEVAATMPKLERLSLYGLGITKQGYQDFRTKRPDVRL